DGVVRGRTWAWLRSRTEAVLGAAAREDAITQRRQRLNTIDAELPARVEQARSSRVQATRKGAGLDAAARLSELKNAFAVAEPKAAEAADAATALTAHLTQHTSEASRIRTTLDARQEKRG